MTYDRRLHLERLAIGLGCGQVVGPRLDDLHGPLRPPLDHEVEVDDPFESATFDVVISRMGSMFFGDPIAAFTNLHRALRPDGRLTLLTWQSVADNEWLTEFRTALAVGRDLPTPPPGVPSPFALADPARVTAILEAAGFTDVSFVALREPMSFGPSIDDAFDFVSQLTGWMLNGLDDADRDRALEALRSTIGEHTGRDGVTFESATWIVQARRA